MSLKTRIVLTLCAAFAILALVFFAVFHVIANNIVAELERDDLKQNIERALQALEREMAELDKSAQDWATWDDTYTFVKDRNREYIEKNLVDNVFKILRINYAVIINTRGEMVYARGYDPEEGEDVPLPREIVLPARQKAGGLKGLVVTPEGAVLVAARPVLKSDGTGPARGILIFGRILNDNHLKELSKITRLPLTLHPPGAVDFRVLQPAGSLENGEACYARIISPEESAGFTVIKDLQGKTALILQVNSDRRAARVFQSAEKAFSLYLALAAVLCCGLALFWLNRAVVSRLAKLTAAVTSTGYQFPLSSGFPVLGGRDELSLLSAEIGKMLDRLEEYRREISDKEKKYRAVVENAAEAVVVVQEGVVKFANRAAAVHTGYTTEEIVLRHFLDFIHPEDREAVWEHYRELLENKGILYAFPFRVIARDGSIKWAETNSVVVEWEGQPATLHFLTDITPRRILEEELQRLMAEKSLILDSLTELVVFIDRDMQIIWANRAAGQSVGRSPGDLFGAKCHEIWHGRSVPCQGCPVVQAVETGQVCAGEVASPDGRLWSITASPVKDEKGNVIGAVEAALDITERRRYEEQLKYLSLHDPLTGLYNRAFFQEELRRLSVSREYPITILVADLDGLKLVNDTLGHARGDEMLKACADVLRNSLRRSDILARIGGDEFAALLPGTDEKTGEDIVYRIRSRIGDYNKEHPELPLHVSTGFATCRSGDESLEDTFKKADDLMYRHKLVHRAGARNQIVGALLAALKEKDYLTAGHAERLKEMCLKMGEKLGLSPRQMADLALLAQVHDLGKVAVPDEILFKKGPLTEEEWEVMRQHPEKGYRIALSSPDLAGVADLILKHHERWDGKGYPLGLRGEEIPVECRILSIADAFDAMTGGRPYLKPRSKEEAIAELKRCAGSHFDPQLVDVFVSLFSDA
ncbi:HD domain-containing phosphohydrolase [Desulfofundulus salinus]|uniref:Diguanylate cyclase n=1 Tax=Desulfofundulus salinus TaxID=2419843 RepID=A0A494WXV1_9FIRM|nr:HD domain-containing phosphohydrolase [Desulfofundulus salinum]RKO67823.1 diguanylate cyclase [Desulfofundulus salinum]